MTEGRERYKQDVEKNMRPNKVTITLQNLIFEKRKYTMKAEVKHNLKSIADVPFHIITADVATVSVRIANQAEKCFASARTKLILSRRISH